MKSLPLFIAALLSLPLLTATAQTVSITATDANAAETLAGQPANPGGILISRTGSTAGALTVWVRVQGVAAQLEDYTFSGFIGTSVVIPAGSASLHIAVNPIDDFLTEGTEDVRIRLETRTDAGVNVPYTIANPDRATVSIADNEDPLAPPRPILTVNPIDTVAMETPGGTNPAVFRITRTNNLSPALNIRYALGGTATAGVDYTALPDTITMPAGAASVDVVIAPIDDTLIEKPESVTFTMLPTDVTGSPLPAEAYALGPFITAGATIISEDIPPQPVANITTPAANVFLNTDVPVTVNFTASAEDGYIVSYRVVASGGASAEGTTDLPESTPAGTPFNGTATLTFTGTVTTQQMLRVFVTNNHGVTAASAAVNIYVVAPPAPPPPPPVATVNIYPLDAAGTEIAADSGLPPDVARFRVTHSFPATSAVSFLFAIGGSAREGVDYTLSSTGTMTGGGGFFGRSFTFPPGTTEAEIVVTPIDDLLIEPDETIYLSLYTPPFIGYFDHTGPFDWAAQFGFYWGASPDAIVTLHSDDTTPPPFPVVTIAATDASATETTDGSDPAVFTVTRTSGPTEVPLTVNYTLNTAGFVARNGLDFPPLPGSVTIPAGATSVEIVVVPTYDLLVESAETLQITLLPSALAWPDPSGYVLDSGTVASAIIRDAVLPAGTPLVAVRVSDASAFREFVTGRTGSFSIERTGGIATSLTIRYTLGGSAMNGVDYGMLSGIATIPVGSLRTTIVINPYIGVSGATETVSITLTPPPLNVLPLPYVIGGTLAMPGSAGISIRDYRGFLPASQIPAKLRHILLVKHHAVLPHPAPPPPPPSAPPPVVALTAVTVWTVEASTDLVNWLVIGTTDPSGENGDFVDLNAGDFPRRFYRFTPPAGSTP